MPTNCSQQKAEMPASERVTPQMPDGLPHTPAAPVRLGRLIGRVYRQWRRQIDLGFKDIGLTDACRAPLLALHTAQAPLRQKELAQALFLETSSLVRVLDQLRAQGLVNWESDPQDRRAKCIELTAQGQQVAQSMLAHSLAIERSILVDLTAQEVQVLRAALEKISRRFESL